MSLSNLLGKASAFRHLLIEASPYDLNSGQSVDRRWANRGYVTEPSDSPSNTYYTERVAPENGFSFARNIFGENRLRGIIRPNIGDIRILAGKSGNLDYIDDDVDLVWSGRDITVKLGEKDASFSNFEAIFSGRGDGASLTENELRIALRDPIQALERPIQDRRFAGTGGLEGPSSLEGQPKPMSLGRVRNVEPVSLGLVDLGDGNLLTFAVGDNTDGINQVLDVYSNGNALTDAGSSAPASGEWKDWPAQGVFQIGGSQGGTVITADVEGHLDSQGSWPSSVADIIELIRDRVASNLSFATNTINNLNNKNNAVVGWWIREGADTLEVIAGLLESIGAYITVNRSGELVLGRIEAPGSPVKTLDETEISKIKRLNVTTPLSNAQVRYERMWFVHNRGDIAAAVSDDRTAKLQTEWTKTSQKAGVSTSIWPNAQDEVFDTGLDAKSDANSERDRLAALFGTQRIAVEITVTGQSLLREIGETITIQTNKTGRFGLGSGKDLVILGIEERAPFDATILTCWG